ncbi:MAG: DegT/DnrJ/EryC1/StrS family aminotransferase [Oscillospiraceae bacterium]|nr:DegT/DnrJ/EryC1/StrS family aminotransferase [Oscillospiraceae bacterium]
MFRMGKEEIDAVTRVINSQALFRVNNGAKECDNFEKELREKIGVDYAILMSGGTGALISALVGLGIGPGDEVIVPGYTFMATASAVLAVGAIPVLAEINESMTLDPADVEKKISSKTKAVVPVHICGFPADLDALKAICKKHGLKLLEDACQADGGSYKGKRLGSIGDAGAYSFNYFKIISAGEGGAVLTNDRKVYERALIYHDGGAAFRPYAGDLQEPVFTGSQLRVSEITGAIMREQLKKLDGILTDLRAIKAKLMESIGEGKDYRFIPSNDIKGDCGTTLAFNFDSEAKARKFAGAVEGTWLPIDSGKHVYINWDPIIEKRGGHCDAVNPYKMAENAGLALDAAGADACPKTLDILKRTVYISLHCDWDEKKISSLTESCKKALATL